MCELGGTGAAQTGHKHEAETSFLPSLLERRELSMRACVRLLLLTSSASAAETDPREWTTADVGGWVARVGLHEYRGAFGEGLVDGRRLLGLTLHELEHELLIPSAEHRMVIEMELGELKLRNGLLSTAERARHRKAHPCIEGWSAKEVRKLLEATGLGRFAAAFFSRGVGGDELLRMSGDELRAVMAEQASREEASAREAAAQLLAAQLEMLRAREC